MSENFEKSDILNDIDNDRLKRMIERIMNLEKENVKTKDLNPNEMKNKIKSIIEEEIECY